MLNVRFINVREVSEDAKGRARRKASFAIVSNYVDMAKDI